MSLGVGQGIALLAMTHRAVLLLLARLLYVLYGQKH